MNIPSLKEDHISQIPALQLLQNLGWVYLSPAEAMALRGGRVSAVILDGILEGQLRKMNRIRYKGAEFAFSEGNIHAAMQALKDVPFDGPVRTNERMYDLLSLGKSMQQSIDGDLKGFTLHYIDWEQPSGMCIMLRKSLPSSARAARIRTAPTSCSSSTAFPLV